MQDSGKSPEQRLVERRHPDHAANLEHHQFLRATYDGGPAYAKDNLFKYPAEPARGYTARKKRAVPSAISRGIIEAYVGYLLKEAPQLAENVPPCIEQFVGNCDGEGTPLIKLARTVATWALTYGTVWLCVDKGQHNTDRELSAAEEIAEGRYPYCQWFLTTAVLDGKMESGEVEWLLVQEDGRDDDDPMTSTGEPIVRYRLWERNRIRCWREAKAQDGSQHLILESDIPNALGRVPFVSIQIGEGSPWAAPGLVSDIAYIEREIYNLQSQLSEILAKVTFPQLRYPLTGGAGSADAKRVLTIGLDSVIPYAAEPGNPGPDYLAPPSGPAQEIRTSIDALKHASYLLALLDGEMTASIKNNSTGLASGVSKAFTFEKLNKRLSVLADTFEQAWLQVFKLVCLWQKVDPETLPADAWDWPDNFEVRSLADDIAEVVNVMAASPPSGKLKAALWIGLARRMFPKMSQDEFDEIVVEIETACENELMGMGAHLLQANEPGETSEAELADEMTGPAEG